MNNVVLKPCPFCGGEAEIIEHLFYNQSPVYGIKCKRCLAETYQFFKSREKVVKAWNRRAGEEDSND